MNKDLPLQDPTKFTQIGIFGLKIYHLATLIGTIFFLVRPQFRGKKDVF
jgi:hypothetical protein